MQHGKNTRATLKRYEAVTHALGLKQADERTARRADRSKGKTCMRMAQWVPRAGGRGRSGDGVAEAARSSSPELWLPSAECLCDALIQRQPQNCSCEKEQLRLCQCSRTDKGVCMSPPNQGTIRVPPLPHYECGSKPPESLGKKRNANMKSRSVMTSVSPPFAGLRPVVGVTMHGIVHRLHYNASCAAMRSSRAPAEPAGPWLLPTHWCVQHAATALW